jgi:hypothetical protein
MPIRLAICLFVLSGCGESAPSMPDAGRDSRPAGDRAAADQTAPDQTAPVADLPLVDRARPDLLAPDTGHRVLAGCIQGSFKPYFGNFHAHTSYSDGKLTPKDAFVHARDVAKLDIMVVTDHLEQLYLPNPDDKYGKCLAQAAAERSATFLTDCGFEYGSAFTPWFSSAGHGNVFFSPTLMPAIQLDFHDFYKSIVACPTCVGQFNHPGDEKDQTWNSFEFNAPAQPKMSLFELNADPAWDLLFVALDAGWQVSPMYNQDNHSADWGTKNDRRSGVFLAALDLASLAAAFRERRTFASYDRNAVIKVMADDLCWMGSVLKGATSMPLSVEVTDPDASDSFTSIQLYGAKKKLLGSFTCPATGPCQTTFTVTTSQSPYFVVRAEQKDGDFLVAAPVWLAP